MVPLKTHLALAGLMLATLLTVPTYAADKIRGEQDLTVSVGNIEAFNKIPPTGALVGTVVTSYAGSAMALTSHIVTVGNTTAPCEGDDCLVQMSFTLFGYIGNPKAVYSRMIDKQTYSIAIITNKVAGFENDTGVPIIKKVKLLLKVKFNSEGIEPTAEAQEVAVK